MPAVTTKAALIALTAREHLKLCKVIAPIGPAQALRKRADDTSIKDVIAHRAHWIGLTLGWIDDGLAGRPVRMPAPGYRWNQLKAYNAALRARQADLGWPAAIDAFGTAHALLMKRIEGFDEATLYGAPLPGGGANGWTPGRFLESCGPSHYRSATKWIRACLRADAG